VWDKNRCKDDTIQTINWFPAPPILIIQPDKFLGCAPADILFTNLSTPIDSTYFIKWTFGDGSEEIGVISPTHTYTDPGFYDVSVEIISPIGCTISGFYPDWIRVVPSPVAAFTYTPDTLLSNFNNTVQFFDQSTDAFRWNWQFGSTAQSSILQNPTHTFQDTGLVQVILTATHQQGCKDTVSVWLDIVPRVLWNMPNAFTPNGDGLNESFFGKGFMDGAREFRFTVWNRWGELVFETTDPQDKWNGRVKNSGGMSPAGVYVWQVNYSTPRGEPINLRGFATLVN
jgi:gliding motility-associated-like protein